MAAREYQTTSTSDAIPSSSPERKICPLTGEIMDRADALEEALDKVYKEHPEILQMTTLNRMKFLQPYIEEFCRTYKPSED